MEAINQGVGGMAGGSLSVQVVESNGGTMRLACCG